MFMDASTAERRKLLTDVQPFGANDAAFPSLFEIESEPERNTRLRGRTKGTIDS